MRKPVYLVTTSTLTIFYKIFSDHSGRRRVPGSADLMAISVDNASLGTEWTAPPPSSADYTCKLGQGKKITKFGGITSFVEFPITPTFSNIQVSRR